jgi:hypothetical protein
MVFVITENTAATTNKMYADKKYESISRAWSLHLGCIRGVMEPIHA